MKGQWKGWVCGDLYITDPAGNNYVPQDILDTFYARQAWRERAGYTHNIYMLKSRLEQMIQSYEEKIKVIEPHYNFIRSAELYLLRTGNDG